MSTKKTEPYYFNDSLIIVPRQDEFHDPNDGHPTGIVDLDTTQLKIADRIKNNILPSTMGLFDIVTEAVENMTVIKIIISSGLEKPYYIKAKGMSPSGCYTRIGTSS